MTSTELDSAPSTDDAPRRPGRALLFLVAAVMLIAGAWLVRWITAPPEIVDSIAAADGRVAPAFVIPSEVDRLIAAYENRVTDHTDAFDYRILGFLYLEKARTTGDVARYAAAEEAFETAISLFPSDPSGRIGLASTYYALHEFTQAWDEAELVFDATQRIDALAVLVDASFALGDYERGDALLESLTAQMGDDAGVLVRRAESARIDGDAATARALALEAVEVASDSSNPRLRSWYEAFAAQMLLYLGDYESGLDFATQAVETDPDSHTAAVTLARLMAASGDHEAAIELYEPIVETTPDPTFLAELRDLYLLTGQDDQAADAFATIEVAATLAEAAGVYDRVIAIYLADHAVDTERAVDIARAELDQRRDVGAYDTLAWALYANGDLDEAAEAAALALARNTADARFLYHAGMIAAARGETDRARDLLEAALELSPEFQPLQADRARQVLSDLG